MLATHTTMGGYVAMNKPYLKRLLSRMMRSARMIRWIAQQPDVVDEVVMSLPEPTTEELITKILERYHHHDIDAQVWLTDVANKQPNALLRRS